MFIYIKYKLFYRIAYKLRENCYYDISTIQTADKTKLTLSELLNNIEKVNNDIFYLADSYPVKGEYITCASEEGIQKVVDYLNSLLIMVNLQQEEEEM